MAAVSKRALARSGRNRLLALSCRSMYGLGLPAPPELRDIVKLDLLEQEQEERIKEVWLDQYRFDPRYISRVLDVRGHETMMSRLEESPLFVWPIHYEATSKYYVLLSQYQHKHIFFTSIDSYTQHAENASAYMSVTFYDDLLSKKQKHISLIRAEVIQSLHLPIEAARNLLDDVLLKYQDDAQYETDILRFNANPSGFDIEQYLNTFDFVKTANAKHHDNANDNSN